MKKLLYFLALVHFLYINLIASDLETGYIIDQPGTITFTTGVKIQGKINKPQVVIFMSKEKSLIRSMDFEYSFKDNIMESLPFLPLKLTEVIK